MSYHIYDVKLFPQFFYICNIDVGQFVRLFRVDVQWMVFDFKITQQIILFMSMSDNLGDLDLFVAPSPSLVATTDLNDNIGIKTSSYRRRVSIIDSIISEIFAAITALLSLQLFKYVIQRELFK